MGLGAIVVIGMERAALCSMAPRGTGPALLDKPLAYVDVLGRSTAQRIVERFVRADVEVVSVLVQAGGQYSVKPSFAAFENVEVQVVNDSSAAVAQKLKEYSRSGIEHSFVVSGTVYAETDLLDLFYFHREARQTATRAIDREGPLDLWVVDCLQAQQSDLKNLLAVAETTRASYFIREYVNRLTHAGNLRRFASDLLQGRCAARPPGQEIKRGIWIDEGADVHRRARIVAPAYIGRASKVMEDTLITRFSNIEKGCCVDYGTVIENSSILENTHVGICLDVCHAVANGNRLFSVERDVVIEISDPSVMRFSSPDRKQARDRKQAKSGFFSRHKTEQRIVPELEPKPERCRLEPNPIQG